MGYVQRRFAAALLVVLAALCACEGGNGSVPAAVVATPAAHPASLRALAMQLTIPATTAASARRAQYLSASTNGILAQTYISPQASNPTVTGSSATDVSAGSPACTNLPSGARTCTVSVPAPVGTDDIVITAYASAPVAGSFPAGSAALSVGTLRAQTMPANGTATLNVSLGGVIASVETTPASNAPMVATTYTLSLTALDAGGNTIVAGSSDPYANPLQVAVSETGGTGYTFVSLDGGTTNSASVTVTQSSQVVTVVFTGGAPAAYGATVTAAAANASTVTPLTLTPPPAGSYTQFYPSPNYNPENITTGPDGNLWVTNYSDEISSVTPNGTIASYSVDASGVVPMSITVGSDHNLWFTERIGNAIATMTTAGVVTATYPVPTASCWPYGITSGPDGNIWFTEWRGNRIGTVNVSTGVVTEFSPLPIGGSQPDAIVAGPDGNLYFTENGNPSNKIGRMSTTGVLLNEYPVPSPTSNPNGIVVGPDGNLWFAEGGSGKIGVVTTGGTFTEYPVPTASSQPQGITVGSDGNLWFTEESANKIGTITTSGVFHEYGLPGDSSPMGITAGPDGYLWYVGYSSRRIGMMAP
jgi:streptogramin lyase